MRLNDILAVTAGRGLQYLPLPNCGLDLNRNTAKCLRHWKEVILIWRNCSEPFSNVIAAAWDPNKHTYATHHHLSYFGIWEILLSITNNFHCISQELTGTQRGGRCLSDWSTWYHYNYYYFLSLWGPICRKLKKKGWKECLIYTQKLIFKILFTNIPHISGF